MKRINVYRISVIVAILLLTLTGCDMRTGEEIIIEETEAQLEEMMEEITQKQIERTKEKIEEYDKIGWFTLDLFSAIPPEAIGKDLIGYVEIFDDEKEKKLVFLEKQYQEEIDLLDRALKTGVTKTTEEHEKMLADVDEKYESRRETVRSSYNKINIIIETAFEQERILLETETALIVKIKEEMRKDIIGHLEDYVTNRE